MPFPSKLLLKDVIKRLQAFDSGFNLYNHKKIERKWILSYSVNKDIKESYPLTAPGGKDSTYIDRERLKVIAKHFDIPSEIFTLTEKEIKNRKLHRK